MKSTRRCSMRRLAFAGILALATAAWLPAAQAQAPRSTTQNSVTVVVTPKSTAGDRDWEFGVKLDTHSQDLSDDLASASVLLVDGTERKPTGWTGAAPGGHHREGILKFAAPATPRATVELRIQRPGENTPRVYRWEAADLR